jgi:hypothetical protein
LTGLGLEQVRVRFWFPFPQFVEQADHPDQFDQSPSTEKETKSYIKTKILKLVFYVTIF